MPEPISSSVRFSVESLLYYAPKIISTGTTLTSAVAAVRQQLTGLGDFYGGSWPDEPFRNSYPPSQTAMLLIADQLAAQIQGIGGGIEQMARTYGITENQNTADVTRIETNESRTAMLLYHTGGLPSPPDNPVALQLPVVQGPVPDPQPNAAPGTAAATPTAAPTPTATSKPTPAPTATASPTPSPEAGYDPTSWQAHGDFSLGGPWPTGDPGRMEQAADYWNTLLSALDTAWSDLQRYTAYILADTQGSAADAFNDYVDALTAPGGGSLTRAIQATQDLHDVCLKQAAEVRALKRTLEETAIELVASIFITQVISFLTMETTQALALAIDAGVAARLTALAEQFAQYSAQLAKIITDSTAVVSKIAAAGLSSGVQSGLIAEFDLLANDGIGLAYGQQPSGGISSITTAAKGFGLGLLVGQGSAGGLLGLSAATASKKLMDLGEDLTDGDGTTTDTGKALITLGRQVKDGLITVSAANSLFTDLLSTGHVTPVALFSDAFSNRLITALAKNTGKHAAP